MAYDYDGHSYGNVTKANNGQKLLEALEAIGTEGEFMDAAKRARENTRILRQHQMGKAPNPREAKRHQARKLADNPGKTPAETQRIAGEADEQALQERADTIREVIDRAADAAELDVWRILSAAGPDIHRALTDQVCDLVGEAGKLAGSLTYGLQGRDEAVRAGQIEAWEKANTLYQQFKDVNTVERRLVELKLIPNEKLWSWEDTQLTPPASKNKEEQEGGMPGWFAHKSQAGITVYSTYEEIPPRERGEGLSHAELQQRVVNSRADWERVHTEAVKTLPAERGRISFRG